MKNTRTQRSGSKILDAIKTYWLGGHKYTKKFQLKTSYGKYDKDQH